MSPRQDRQEATAVSVIAALVLGWSLRAAGNYYWEWRYLKLSTEPDQLMAAGAGIMLLSLVLLVCIAVALSEEGNPK